MLAITSRHHGNAVSYKSPARLLCFVIACLFLNGCSNIVLKPKDPELLSMENFAKTVTAHLFELNPISYAEFQKSLETEISPDVLSQLRKKGFCASSSNQVHENIRIMDTSRKRCLIRIESTGFPQKVTAQGLVPVEVQGTCVKSVNDVSKTSKFDVIYLVGNRVGTKKPIIASIEIKKFD